MRAIVIDRPGSVAIETIADPTPSAGEVVVQVEGCGLCGTDLHLIDGDLPYQNYPLVPGHEFSGTVVAVATDVPDRWLGQRVTLDPNILCGVCDPCRRGRSNLCENYRAVGVTQGGGFAEFAAVPVSLVYPLDERLPADIAPLVEPLSCAIHGFDMLPRRFGDSYLVYGAGPMGLMMAMLAAEAHGADVGIVELQPARREIAAELGLHVATSADELDRPQGFDVVIDCTGAVAAMQDGLTRVRRGGTFQCFGVASPEARLSISPFNIYRNEISIVGSMAVHHSIGRSIDLLTRRGSELRPIVTGRFDLDEFPDAVEAARSGRGAKSIVTP